MRADIKVSKACGEIIAPPSKSMAHRMLICAALSSGVSKIYNIACSQDILATLDCLAALGAEYCFKNDFVEIKGITPENVKSAITANCRESGSTLRFMIPIMLLFGKKITLTGSEYLFSRPLKIYEDICKNDGISYDLHPDKLILAGSLKSREYVIPGNISSQFISGLLFALPLLENDSKIIISGNLESRSYIDLTISALNKFGVSIKWNSDSEIYIPGKQSYKSVDSAVEGDFSNAAFFEAFNLFGDSVKISGLDANSLQGDKVFFEYFKKLKESNPLLDINNCPDLAPILFVVAAYFNGARFIGTKRLKIKESDRGAAMKEELSKFGCNVFIEDNEIIVEKCKLHKPNVVLNGHNDHRIVMALSVLLTRFGGQITQAEAVHKSFPDFFDKLTQLGIEVALGEN